LVSSGEAHRPVPVRPVGVAIIIIDQLPSAVAPEVIKNTGSKLAFRQVDAADREIVGDAMLSRASLLQA